ncbi:MAG: alpha-amylase family protein [Actinomycetota bacterium]|nr:alpha-amylase family protein [Actinomycetota bacterium]
MLWHGGSSEPIDGAALRAAVLDAREARHWATVQRGLNQLYPAAADSLGAELRELVRAHVGARSQPLFVRDLVREAQPGWFQSPAQVGYVCYADLFADTLRGVAERLDYLAELGVSYLHLMPLLRPRDGENDGGYAVAAYDEVNPALGTMADLAALAGSLHDRDMNLCVDLVLNHTAAEHPWARMALAGHPEYRDHYLFFPDRTLPDRYEETLLQVFPNFAPGNFTWLPGDGTPDSGQWVWTTFHEFQWDLNWANPAVFRSMFEVMLDLARQGVDMLRLDAAPFMWKREGTICQNLPEVHVLLCTLRALMAIAAPATAFKAEAIVAPDELTPYLGAGTPERHECDLAYNNQLMVLLWSSLATGDAELMSNALRRMGPIPSHAAWVNYVRCHDDIGWAIMPADAKSVGWDSFAHRDFLLQFFAGSFAGSFATGDIFQYDPETGDGRTSGTAASLCGIDRALADGDLVHLEMACARLELMYAVVYAYGGIPLLYMGDELGLRNDMSYLADPAKADDNRWMHRPRMDWTVAARRHAAGTLEARLFAMFVSLAADRAAIGALDAAATLTVLPAVNPHVFCFTRTHPAHGTFTMLANFGHGTAVVALSSVGAGAATVQRSAGATVDAGVAQLATNGYLWLTSP